MGKLWKTGRLENPQRILPFDDADAELPYGILEGQTKESPDRPVGWRFASTAGGPLGRGLGSSTGRSTGGRSPTGGTGRARLRTGLVRIDASRQSDLLVLPGDGGGRGRGGRGHRLGAWQP